MKKVLFTAVAVVVVAAGVATAVVMNRDRDEAWKSLPTVHATRGEFVVTIPEVGVLKARRNATAISPFYEKVLKLVPEETVVEEGDPVVWLDTTRFEETMIRETATFESAKARLDKALEQLRIDLLKNKLTMEQKEGDLEFARVEARFTREKYNKVKQLVEADVLAQRRLDAAEKEMDDKEFGLKKAESDFAAAREDSRVKEQVNEYERVHAKADFDRAERRFNSTKERIDEAVVKAPAAGTVFYARVWKQSGYGKVQEGDQAYNGRALVNIPDLSEMLVKSQVGESNLGRISDEMPVRVRVDSFPDEEFAGYIEAVGTMAIDRRESEGAGFIDRESIQERVFELTVRLDPTDEQLRPGSTCEVEIVTNTVQDAVSVPLDAAFRVEGEDVVFVVGEDDWDKRVVETGDRNRKNVIVTKGLNGDEQLLLEKPKTEEDDEGQGPELVTSG
jgi:HlyD family secretion protein